MDNLIVGRAEVFSVGERDGNRRDSCQGSMADGPASATASSQRDPTEWWGAVP